jgi:selenium metabolism protein YedF
MTKEIDARGQACPKPVIMTKHALDEIAEGVVRVLVNDPVARENVERFARSAGCAVEIGELENGAQAILITKNASAAGRHPSREASPRTGPTVFLINSDRLGRGEDDLGRILAKAFVFALAETDGKPEAIVFMNTGVRLITEGSGCLENLQRLSAAGVAIVGCGTCLDFYGLKDQVKIGTVSNMYDIAARLMTAGKVVTM